MADIKEFINHSWDFTNYQGFVVTPDDHIEVVKKGDPIKQGCKEIADVKVVDAVDKYFKKNKKALSKEELKKIHEFSEHLKQGRELKKKGLPILRVVKNFFSRCQNLVLIHKFTTSNKMIQNIMGAVNKELKEINKKEQSRYEKSDLPSAILRHDSQRVRELLNLPEDKLEDALKSLEEGKEGGRNALYLIVLVNSNKSKAFRYWDVTVEEILAANKKLGDKRLPIDVKLDFWGSTPLHCAASQSNVEALKLLLEAGASPTLTDQKGQTALHRAAVREHNDFEKDARSVEVIRLLLEKGADPSLKDADGYTAADYWEKRKKRISPEDFIKIQELLKTP